ncbi:hypothetical protein [Roseicyclus sp.]|uniref:hypothetical protein n=1 Tax=Roseicyclus sp. TaxID=1914329 RepID=UPI003F9FACFE
MKRTILSLTTAIALALPATAQQTDVEATVSDLLVANGYAATSIDLLTQGEIAELYIASTSEEMPNIDALIASYDLPADGAEMTRESFPETDVEMEVRDILEARGYAPDMVNALSGPDIANIYITATSGDDTGLGNAIESAIEANMAMVTADPSGAEERAIEYLQRRGYSADEIATFEQAELLEVYNALTSGDQTRVDGVIDGVLQS